MMVGLAHRTSRRHRTIWAHGNLIINLIIDFGASQTKIVTSSGAVDPTTALTLRAPKWAPFPLPRPALEETTKLDVAPTFQTLSLAARDNNEPQSNFGLVNSTGGGVESADRIVLSAEIERSLARQSPADSGATLPLAAIVFALKQSLSRAASGLFVSE